MQSVAGAADNPVPRPCVLAVNSRTVRKLSEHQWHLTTKDNAATQENRREVTFKGFLAFGVYAFPCSRAYFHSWTGCPFLIKQVSVFLLLI